MNFIEKNQNGLPLGAKQEWNTAIRNAVSALNKICELYEKYQLDHIEGYPFPASLDEYSFLISAMEAKIE